MKIKPITIPENAKRDYEKMLEQINDILKDKPKERYCTK